MKPRCGPATVRGVVLPCATVLYWMGRPKGWIAPSQETDLEKFSDASSGIRSGESSYRKSLCLSLEVFGLGERAMRKIICIVNTFVFAIFTSVTWGDPPIVESSGNTLSVESSGNTLNVQSSVVLPEVVVTANRLDTPVSQVANSMTVITAKDIEQKQSSTVLDALQGVPGLTQTQNGGPGQNSGLFIRGADSGHTLVLMDGIPINNPISPSRDFEYLDQLFLDGVSQIEVVRGPLSTLYGTNATAGVVNIITQKGDGTSKGSVLLEGGTYNTFREAATASAGDKLGNFTLSVSRFETDGYPSADKTLGNMVNNGDGNSTASFRLDLSPLSNLENNVTVRYVKSRDNLDAFGGANGDDPNYFLDEQQWIVGSQSKLKLFNGDWEQVLGFSFTDDLQKYTDDFSSFINSHFERGAYEGQAAQINWQNNVNLLKGETLVAGIQLQQEWGRLDDTTDYGFGSSNAFVNQTTTTGSYFIENQTSLLDRLFITEGGRLDVVSSFGSQWTYRGTAAYFIPDIETKLKATYGTGFNAPTIYQLYSPYGSTSLQAESSDGWDAGFEQPFLGEKIKVGATYFQTHFSNLIDFVTTATPPNYGQYVNIGKAETEGWETFASAKPFKNLDIRADYTYNWAINVQTGAQLQRRPQNQADFSASYQLGGASLGFSVLYIGDRSDLSFVNYVAVPVALPTYTLVNVMASYDFNSNIKLFGRVENLFNTIYEEIYGYGTPGLSFYAGTKITM